MFNFLKSKKKVSLMDFHNQVGELAVKYGKDHWNTRVQVTEHLKRKVSFDAYIPDLGWVMDKPTVKDVLDYFKERHTGDSLPTILMFAKDPEKDIAEFIGGDMSEFIKTNNKKVSECFKSFAYGSASDRRTYDDACEAITDDEKLKEFKAKHEDKNRSSLSQWVKAAWRYGDMVSGIK